MQNAKWPVRRKWLGELATIVLGVLIALALAWIAILIVRQRDGASARRAIAIELGGIIGQGIERANLSPCVERRLDALAPFVDQAAASGKLTAIGEFGMPRPREWPLDAWAAAADTGARAHFDRDDRAALARIYRQVSALAEDGKREIAVWTRLYAMVGPGRAVTPAEAAALRDAIVEARTLDRNFLALGRTIKQTTDQRHIGYDADAVRAASSQPAETFAICQPVGAVPDHYGRSPI